MALSALSVVRWASRVLLDDDPEWFVGGCADIAAVIEEFTKRIEVVGVTAEYGTTYTRRSGTFHHAWLRVGKRIYDPRSDLEGLSFGRYRVVPGMSCEDPFGVEPWVVDWKAGELVEQWNQSTPKDRRTVLSARWLRRLRDRLDDLYSDLSS